MDGAFSSQVLREPAGAPKRLSISSQHLLIAGLTKLPQPSNAGYKRNKQTNRGLQRRRLKKIIGYPAPSRVQSPRFHERHSASKTCFLTKACHGKLIVILDLFKTSKRVHSGHAHLRSIQDMTVSEVRDRTTILRSDQGQSMIGNPIAGVAINEIHLEHSWNPPFVIPISVHMLLHSEVWIKSNLSASGRRGNL